jgi:hypothetical protein
MFLHFYCFGQLLEKELGCAIYIEIEMKTTSTHDVSCGYDHTDFIIHRSYQTDKSSRGWWQSKYEREQQVCCPCFTSHVISFGSWALI